ncbi:hypothetical protein LWF01_15620 [Saxibacter everestensis]|uniref:CBU-0592-like domain-containing protein n=1 Tax=Saxibacter everestensis TaxID=2909229 RepID=A0ABY8QR94_9MICO|nr:hypothetical protein LWF01_15620 [Brevibacteriaceae bacterium ZFBP1038]
MDISMLLSGFGWLGALCTVSGYALLSNGRIGPNSPLFQGLNIGGSILLCCSAAISQAWPSAAVNGLWILIGVQAWLMLVRRAKKAAADKSSAGTADIAPTLVLPIIPEPVAPGPTASSAAGAWFAADPEPQESLAA